MNVIQMVSQNWLTSGKAAKPKKIVMKEVCGYNL